MNDQISGTWPSQAGWFDTTHDNHLDIGLDTHGAEMPVDVAARCVSWHSNVRGVVLEPFSGTGTTLVACEQLGRKCRAMEISPAYVDLAVARWEALTGRKATHKKKDPRQRAGG